MIQSTLFIAIFALCIIISNAAGINLLLLIFSTPFVSNIVFLVVLYGVLCTKVFGLATYIFRNKKPQYLLYIIFIDRCIIPSPLQIDHCRETCNSSDHTSWNVTLTEHGYNSYLHQTTITYHVNMGHNMHGTVKTGVCSESYNTDRAFIDTFYLLFDGCCMEPRIGTVTAGTMPNKEYGFNFIKVTRV